MRYPGTPPKQTLPSSLPPKTDTTGGTGLLVYNRDSGKLKGSSSPVFVHVGYDGWWLKVLEHGLACSGCLLSSGWPRQLVAQTGGGAGKVAVAAAGCGQSRPSLHSPPQTWLLWLPDLRPRQTTRRMLRFDRRTSV